jgi:hypothetical protein
MTYRSSLSGCGEGRARQMGGWVQDLQGFESGRFSLREQFNSLQEDSRVRCFVVRRISTGVFMSPVLYAPMAEQILGLLKGDALREKMAQPGREAVETKFELRRNVARLLNVDSRSER